MKSPGRAAPESQGVNGVSVESTRDVLMRYFGSSHDNLSMMAPDVVFRIMATGEEYCGPEGVAQMLHQLYQVAFDATAETRNLIVGDGKAAWEGDFVGKHIGEFMGIPPTNKDVRVPLCVVYDVAGNQITAGRVYFEGPALLAQLGVAPPGSR